MADRHFVKSQPIKVIKSKQKYWDYVHTFRRNTDGEPQELPTANPDVLAERENTGPTEAQVLIGSAVEHLQGRQKEVYLLLYRYGKSMSEVATVLDISKSAVQMYKLRAVKFITQYCTRALETKSND